MSAENEEKNQQPVRCERAIGGLGTWAPLGGRERGRFSYLASAFENDSIMEKRCNRVCLPASFDNFPDQSARNNVTKGIALNCGFSLGPCILAIFQSSASFLR